MTPEIITILGMAITILGANWAMFHSLRAEIKDVRAEMKEESKITNDKIDAIHSEMIDKTDVIHGDIAKLSERMARVEGMIDGLREAIVARSVA